MSHHRALLLPDILTLIFEHTRPAQLDSLLEYHQDARNYRTALARSAQVCKTFSEPALRTLWSSIPTFAPVIRLLSCCHCTKVEQNDGLLTALPRCYAYVLRGRIQPDEWSRFQYYARFVRRCGLDTDGAVIDPSVYAYLFRCNGGHPLFPGLQHLVWSQELPNETSLLFFLAPSLRRLTFKISSDQGEDSAPTVMDYALETLLSNVTEVATHLEELTLVGVRHWQSMTPLVECKELKHLDLYNAWPTGESISDVLSILTGLPQLSSLDIWCSSSVASRRGVGDPTHLPHLVILGAGGDDNSIASLLANVVLPQLENLSLELTYETSGYGIDRSIREFSLAAVAPRLRTLFIETRTEFVADDAHGLPRSLLDIIKPLLDLTQLVDFGFRLTQLPINVSDDDIRQITEPWPKLEALSLDVPLSTVCPSLHTLNIIAQNCPALERLSLPSVFHNTDIPDTTGLQQHRLMELYVHIHGLDVDQSSHYVSSLFPFVEMIAQDWTLPAHATLNEQLPPQ